MYKSLLVVGHRCRWMKRADSPGIADLHHGVLRLFLGDVFRAFRFLLLLLFLRSSPLLSVGAGCALWLGAALRLGAALWLGAPLCVRPAAQGGSGGDMYPQTLTHCRGLAPPREQPPAGNKVHTYEKQTRLFSHWKNYFVTLARKCIWCSSLVTSWESHLCNSKFRQNNSLTCFTRQEAQPKVNSMFILFNCDS